MLLNESSGSKVRIERKYSNFFYGEPLFNCQNFTVLQIISVITRDYLADFIALITLRFLSFANFLYSLVSQPTSAIFPSLSL